MNFLGALLRVKKANEGTAVNGLEEEIKMIMIHMKETDVQRIEEIVGIKAL